MNRRKQITNRSDWSGAIKFCLIILLFVAIFFTLYRAWYSRYMADDYCVSAGANASNLLEFVRINYQNWSGRYSAFLHTWLFSQFGPRSIGAFFTILMLFWIFLLRTIFLNLSTRFKFKVTKANAIMLALIIVLVTIETSPSKFQSFLWRDGFIHHTLPLIWMTFAAVVFFQLSNLGRAPNWYSCLLLFLVVIISGGFSETSSLSFLALYLIMGGTTLVTGHKLNTKSEKRLLIIVLLAALSALLIEYASPGNQIRRSLLPMGPQNLIQVVGFSIRNIVFIFGKYLVYSPHLAILAVGAGYFILGNDTKSACSTRTFILTLVGLIFTLMVLLLSIVFPVVVLIHAYPDDRIITIANFYISVVLVAGGFLLNTWFNHLTACKEFKCQQNLQGIVQIGLIFLIILTTLSLGEKLTSDNQMLIDYADRWDRREENIIHLKSIGEVILTVPGLESRDLVADIGFDPEDWVNSCVAAYYGVGKIIGR